MKLSAFGMGALFLAGWALAQDQPATSGSGPWMVFFDWSRAEIRADDRTILDQVVSAFLARPGVHLQLTGHTDRSGSPSANRRAGLKRAQVLRAELEKRGIPRNALSIASFGEQQPLVPTEDGVREVQNRRVVITLKE